MQISPRIEYLIYAALCALNALLMLLMVFGAATTGSGIKPLLWPQAVLFVLGVLMLAAFSAHRATQIGHSGWTAALATLLLCAMGPAVLLPIVYLAMSDETDGAALRARQAPPAIIGLQALVLLVLPWLLLWAAHSLWSHS